MVLVQPRQQGRKPHAQNRDHEHDHDEHFDEREAAPPLDATRRAAASEVEPRHDRQRFDDPADSRDFGGA
jgi:hypothetical protein